MEIKQANLAKKDFRLPVMYLHLIKYMFKQQPKQYLTNNNSNNNSNNECLSYILFLLTLT